MCNVVSLRAPTISTDSVGVQFCVWLCLELEPSMFRDPRAVLALLVFCAAFAWTMVLLT